jgi:hypothetical protein
MLKILFSITYLDKDYKIKFTSTLASCKQDARANVFDEIEDCLTILTVNYPSFS